MTRSMLLANLRVLFLERSLRPQHRFTSSGTVIAEQFDVITSLRLVVRDETQQLTNPVLLFI